ncbi:hypothetical protein QPB47_001858 [Campylobacter jejuni]|nr:hypothetical protein [Campylobacter jejuni]ELU3320784.1 hypothetical protein [Campylobacter jejuni]
MMKCEWILCPVCGSKTRNKIRKDTVFERTNSPNKKNDIRVGYFVIP